MSVDKGAVVMLKKKSVEFLSSRSPVPDNPDFHLSGPTSKVHLSDLPFKLKLKFAWPAEFGGPVNVLPKFMKLVGTLVTFVAKKSNVLPFCKRFLSESFNSTTKKT